MNLNSDMKRGNAMRYFGVILMFTSGLLLSACGLSSRPESSVAERSETAEQSSAVQTESSDSTEKSEDSFPDLHDFQASTLDGSSFLPSDFAAADVTAINIWSTTCGPCVREMPELAEYAKTLPDNLRIMTWCLDANISATGAEIEKYLTECGFTGITLASGNGDMQTLYEQLLYTPTTIFVDANGNLVAEPLIGAGDIEARYSKQFQAALEELGIESSVSKDA